MRADPAYWTLAVPATHDDALALLRPLAVVVVPDGEGGFVHNGAIHLLDERGRLRGLFEFDQWPQALAAAHRLAIPVVPLPGASSVTTLLSAAGMTQEGGFVFAGFLPTKAAERERAVSQLAAEAPGATVLVGEPEHADDYVADWEQEIAGLPTVVDTSATSLPPRTLVAGVEMGVIAGVGVGLLLLLATLVASLSLSAHAQPVKLSTRMRGSGFVVVSA